MRLILLSNKFYNKYKNCSEILQKDNRPYVCLAIRIENILFAIPFRHHISHRYAFFTGNDSGIDYTKAVVISDNDFISTDQVHIEQSEFNALKGKETVICNGMKKYLHLYQKAYHYKANPKYKNILHFSSLKHFHEYLNL